MENILHSISIGHSPLNKRLTAGEAHELRDAPYARQMKFIFDSYLCQFNTHLIEIHMKTAANRRD